MDAHVSVVSIELDDYQIENIDCSPLSPQLRDTASAEILHTCDVEEYDSSTIYQPCTDYEKPIFCSKFDSQVGAIPDEAEYTPEKKLRDLKIQNDKKMQNIRSDIFGRPERKRIDCGGINKPKFKKQVTKVAFNVN